MWRLCQENKLGLSWVKLSVMRRYFTPINLDLLDRYKERNLISVQLGWGWYYIETIGLYSGASIWLILLLVVRQLWQNWINYWCGRGRLELLEKRLFVYLFKGNRPFILDGADDHHEFSNKFNNNKLGLSWAKLGWVETAQITWWSEIQSIQPGWAWIGWV